MSKLSRRDMLRTSVAGSAAVISWLRPRTALADEHSLLPPPATPGQFAYFTAREIAFLDAAVSRLIPNDELGPGAKEAGVTFFIDQQMAGPFGRAETWYMQGPWKQGTEQQGYQLKLIRNTWGNRASTVSASQVAKVREEVRQSTGK